MSVYKYSSKQCDTIINTLCYRTYKIFRRVKIKLELMFFIASKYIRVNIINSRLLKKFIITVR